MASLLPWCAGTDRWRHRWGLGQNMCGAARASEDFVSGTVYPDHSSCLCRAEPRPQPGASLIRPPAMQTGRMRGSVSATLTNIWQQEGLKGLFKCVRALPSSCVAPSRWPAFPHLLSTSLLPLGGSQLCTPLSPCLLRFPTQSAPSCVAYTRCLAQHRRHSHACPSVVHLTAVRHTKRHQPAALLTSRGTLTPASLKL